MSLSALTYPQVIRSTGAGWALGAGRVGTISGPLSAGVLMARGLHAQKLFLLAATPAFSTALLMAMLGRWRHEHTRAVESRDRGGH
jgi:AAHS family 4-hydroxybenzoate transporter-like MFS transporter